MKIYTVTVVKEDGSIDVEIFAAQQKAKSYRKEMADTDGVTVSDLRESAFPIKKDGLFGAIRLGVDLMKEHTSIPAAIDIDDMGSILDDAPAAVPTMDDLLS